MHDTFSIQRELGYTGSGEFSNRYAVDKQVLRHSLDKCGAFFRETGVIRRSKPNMTANFMAEIGNLSGRNGVPNYSWGSFTKTRVVHLFLPKFARIT